MSFIQIHQQGPPPQYQFFILREARGLGQQLSQLFLAGRGVGPGPHSSSMSWELGVRGPAPQAPRMWDMARSSGPGACPWAWAGVRLHLPAPVSLHVGRGRCRLWRPWCRRPRSSPGWAPGCPKTAAPGGRRAGPQRAAGTSGGPVDCLWEERGWSTYQAWLGASWAWAGPHSAPLGWEGQGDCHGGCCSGPRQGSQSFSHPHFLVLGRCWRR